MEWNVTRATSKRIRKFLKWKTIWFSIKWLPFAYIRLLISSLVMVKMVWISILIRSNPVEWAKKKSIRQLFMFDTKRRSSTAKKERKKNCSFEMWTTILSIEPHTKYTTKSQNIKRMWRQKGFNFWLIVLSRNVVHCIKSPHNSRNAGKSKNLNPSDSQPLSQRRISFHHITSAHTRKF